MPNHIARSSLFALVRTNTVNLQPITLVSRGDATIQSNVMLDESVADVWMQLLFEARRVRLGALFSVDRSSFLSQIGRNCSGASYRWLARAMQQLSRTRIVIHVRNPAGGTILHVGNQADLLLLDRVTTNQISQAVHASVDARWAVVIQNNQYSLIDWPKRLAIARNQPSARALQRLVATSSDPVQRHSLSWLKGKLGYTGRDRDFMVALHKAFDELQRVEIIKNAYVGTSSRGVPQTVWTRL